MHTKAMLGVVAAARYVRRRTVDSPHLIACLHELALQRDIESDLCSRRGS
jgi:hypothetical protein